MRVLHYDLNDARSANAVLGSYLLRGSMDHRLDRLAGLARKHDLRMQDGPFFNDTKLPFITADVASVTLATTDKALYPTTAVAPAVSNYWGYPGKRLRIMLFGRITTGTTPGNGTWDVYWGSGADATGTILASSAAFALTASQTNLSWRIWIDVYARALGTSGALMCTGETSFNNAVVASTLQPVLIPASAPAQVTVDTTAANIVSVQFKRSGSTAETMQVHDIWFGSMN